MLLPTLYLEQLWVVVNWLWYQNMGRVANKSHVIRCCIEIVKLSLLFSDRFCVCDERLWIWNCLEIIWFGNAWDAKTTGFKDCFVIGWSKLDDGVCTGTLRSELWILRFALWEFEVAARRTQIRNLHVPVRHVRLFLSCFVLRETHCCRLPFLSYCTYDARPCLLEFSYSVKESPRARFSAPPFSAPRRMSALTLPSVLVAPVPVYLTKNFLKTIRLLCQQKPHWILYILLLKYENSNFIFDYHKWVLFYFQKNLFFLYTCNNVWIAPSYLFSLCTLFLHTSPSLQCVFTSFFFSCSPSSKPLLLHRAPSYPIFPLCIPS
jgi:hypothetical protein